MRIERHDINRNSTYMPKSVLTTHPECHSGPPKHGTPAIKDGEIMGWNLSILDEMKNAYEKGKTHRLDLFLRNDILFKNEGERQYLVYIEKEGKISGNLNKFTKDELDWAREESRKCWEVALKEPLFMTFYYSR